MAMTHAQVINQEVHQLLVTNKKEEKNKDITAAVDFNNMVVEAQEEIINIQIIEKTLQEAEEKREQEKTSAKDIADQARLQEEYLASQEKISKNLIKEIDKAIADAKEKLNAIQDEKNRIINAWGGETFAQGLKVQADEIVGKNADNTYKLATKVEESYEQSIKDNLGTKILFDEQGKLLKDAVTLQDRLHQKVDQRIEAFMDYLKDPDSNKSPLQLQILTLGIRSQINEDIAEFNREIEKHNKTLPKEQQLALITPPSINVKMLAKFANDQHTEKLESFQKKMKDFLGLDTLNKQERQLQENLNALQGKIKTQETARQPAPIIDSQAKIQKPVTAACYDADAGTPYALDTLNVEIFKGYAKDIAKKDIAKKITVTESGPNTKFSLGEAGNRNFSYNNETKVFTTDSADADTLKAMLIMAKKTYGSQTLDISLDSKDATKVKQMCKDIGINVNLKKLDESSPSKERSTTQDTLVVPPALTDPEHNRERVPRPKSS